jgi:hypothetical protein
VNSTGEPPANIVRVPEQKYVGTVGNFYWRGVSQLSENVEYNFNVRIFFYTFTFILTVNI